MEFKDKFTQQWEVAEERGLLFRGGFCALPSHCISRRDFHTPTVDLDPQRRFRKPFSRKVERRWAVELSTIVHKDQNGNSADKILCERKMCELIGITISEVRINYCLSWFLIYWVEGQFKILLIIKCLANAGLFGWATISFNMLGKSYDFFLAFTINLFDSLLAETLNPSFVEINFVHSITFNSKRLQT